MKVTIAIDSFKGSLSTFKAGEAIKDGIKKVVKSLIFDERDKSFPYIARI